MNNQYGDLTCAKHMKRINMILTDNKVPLKDRLLCQSCIVENNIVSENFMPLSEAKQMIEKICSDSLEESLNHSLKYQNRFEQNQTSIGNPQIINPLKNLKKIRTFKSQHCHDMVFNKQKSLLVIGDREQIKIRQFKGKLIQKWIELKTPICCLTFSKTMNWFFSSSQDTIIGWKNERNGWISKKVNSDHTDWINRMILNKNEDQLISCNQKGKIIVWQVNFEINEITYYYTLKNKNLASIISLSSNETHLVACQMDGILTQWIKINDRWEYNNQIKVDYGYSVCFINDFQFLYQPSRQNHTQIFSIDKNSLQEQPNLKIHLQEVQKDNLYDAFLFRTIYNEKRQIIIQRHLNYVYIIQRGLEGNFKIAFEPIYFEGFFARGQLTEDGEHLIIWNGKTQQIITYQISY